MFVLDDASVRLMDEVTQIFVPLDDWQTDPAQWRKAWELGWELVGLIHFNAVPQRRAA